MAEPVTLGVIVGVHGVRGLVRVKSFTEDPDDIAAYGPLKDDAGKSYKLEVTGRAKGVLLVRIAGVGDRNAAEALKGTELLIDRDRLPEADEDEFYHADLIGLQADQVAGGTLGTVAAVQNFGAGDLLEIRLPDSRKTVLVPFDESTVPEIDLEGGRLLVDPPAGLLDEASDEDRKAEADHG
ncbi:ribosome maturation factor RimM [Nisaea acidiphila]|uniref:Ribosome maturation factor RimM n=1 Tax=Nisaea acidiphila TaxID=1862145 RepID=A0A9J7ALJ4_9PROT|nr:ribosome maturation factor RimM [Nisaea acidiphila]UUX48030.1 ribosome maturation factor RimM [Nisaea acidiphila]